MINTISNPQCTTFIREFCLYRITILLKGFIFPGEGRTKHSNFWIVKKNSCQEGYISFFNCSMQNNYSVFESNVVIGKAALSEKSRVKVYIKKPVYMVMDLWDVRHLGK